MLQYHWHNLLCTDTLHVESGMCYLYFCLATANTRQTAWNWGLYTGFFWSGFCFLCIIYTWFRIPEPTGRTYAELDLLFERGVSARKFASTKVDVFEGHDGVQDVAAEGVVKDYERKLSNAGDFVKGQPETKTHNRAMGADAF